MMCRQQRKLSSSLSSHGRWRTRWCTIKYIAIFLVLAVSWTVLDVSSWSSTFGAEQSSNNDNDTTMPMFPPSSPIVTHGDNNNNNMNLGYHPISNTTASPVVKNKTSFTQTFRFINASATVPPPLTISTLQRSLIACQWSPTDRMPCLTLLRRRLPWNNNNSSIPPIYLFGDSTMYKLFNLTTMQHTLVEQPLRQQSDCGSCTAHTSTHCNLTYGIPSTLPVDDYRKPVVSLEGPVATGWAKPGCADCGGCESYFLTCPTSACPAVLHGGFVHMEFARDVEWQTQLFATTQENTAYYLLLQQHALCVMSVGFHDMMLPHHSQSMFLQNVEWYVNLYLKWHACDHIVWITNNAPQVRKHENYTQSYDRVLAWNEGVIRTVVGNAELQSKVTVVDVFAAAVNEHHCDNLHMGPDWYQALAKLILQSVGVE